jgi:Holliday junction DNA helicase RuvA
MFHYLSGLVTELFPNLAVIDCGGVGFEVNTSAYTLSQLKAGEKAKLYTYVHIREDAFEIYGFSGKSEKRCFEMLLGVSGVGPKAALSILSVNTPESLIMSIVSGNERAITAAAGVGKKIAQRVILELKDKIAKDSGFSNESFSAPAVPASDNSAVGDAVAALTVLGYGSNEIAQVLKTVDTSGMSTEQIIKTVLRRMVK